MIKLKLNFLAKRFRHPSGLLTFFIASYLLSAVDLRMLGRLGWSECRPPPLTDSPADIVIAEGLAASQFARIRKRDPRLKVLDPSL